MKDINGDDLSANLKNFISQGKEFTTLDLISRVDLTTLKDIHKLSKVSKIIKPVLEKISYLQETEETSIDDQLEYDFLIKINDYSPEIQAEISLIHNFIKIRYTPRFPELSSLITNPVDYAKTVKLLGNNLDINLKKHEDQLKSFLTSEKILVVTMSASLQEQQNLHLSLSEEELETIINACDLLLWLDASKTKITNYVSSRLSKFAPNLTSLVGAHISAQLMSAVGGLANLSSTPSCNIPAIGNKRQVGIGFGQVGIRLQGILYYHELIQQIPDDYRKQALRMLSGKIVLAARIDLSKSHRDGNLGVQYKDEILTKLEKLQIPPENNGVKPLPIPIDKKSKKRSGKRFTKFKKQFEMSDLQKAQNRMAFGAKEEVIYDAFGQEIGMGMAGKSSGTGVRAVTASTANKAKMSKSMANRLANNSHNGTGLIENNDDTLFFANPDAKQLEASNNNENSSRWFTDKHRLENLKRAHDSESDTYSNSNSLKRLKR
ncbi:hypothetical protein PACTADRAFT_50751 [Pachysolen tannophilus NRRL Y-2460]|uniref:Nop domain-containing protein n=1 Tax=Pachysolen tannophilus NRRL Y-2460 TaxID=669874 RepID=A0A1E4TT23_PACTA|nr:hypothetical protein PACTADRAFT_50751 [Pachysolen tannophilus NRRL Y-2460]